MRPVRLTVGGCVQAGVLALDRKPASARFVGDQRLLAAIWRATDVQPELSGLTRQELSDDLQRRAMELHGRRRCWVDSGVLKASMPTAKRTQLRSGLYTQRAVGARKEHPWQRHHA